MSKLYETYNKFNEKKSDTKVRVFCRICYANIWEPKSILGSEPKFSVSCLFDKEDKLTLGLLGQAVDAAKEAGKEKWGEKFLKAPKFKLPLHDGDIDRPDDGAYEGMMYINATSKDKPEVVDRRKNPITDPMMVGSGDERAKGIHKSVFQLLYYQHKTFKETEDILLRKKKKRVHACRIITIKEKIWQLFEKEIEFRYQDEAERGFVNKLVAETIQAQEARPDGETKRKTG